MLADDLSALDKLSAYCESVRFQLRVIFFKLTVERARGDAKNGSGAFAVAPYLFTRAQNVLPLHLMEGR